MFIVVKRNTIWCICICMVAAFILINVIHYAVEAVTTPVQTNVIVIDPGHGGRDPGASGKLGVPEKDINLKISLKLKALLEQNNYTVILTRNDDSSLHDEDAKRKKASDFKNRKKIIEQYNPKLLVSIHLNSFSQEKYYGAQVFYPLNCERSKMAGNIIQEELKNNIQNGNNRQAKSITNVALLRGIKVPAVIVECGFLSNQNEESLLITDDYQGKLADAICKGMLKYLLKP